MVWSINLVGGPASGKSTIAAQVFAELKHRHYEVELVTEVAKDMVWDEHYFAMENQIYMLGQQYHRIHRLLGKVDYIVTDAPILLELYYGRTMPKSFLDLVMDLHRKTPSLNVFLKRPSAYSAKGRQQTKEQAIQVDKDLRSAMDSRGILYLELEATRDAYKDIVEEVLSLC